MDFTLAGGPTVPASPGARARGAGRGGGNAIGSREAGRPGVGRGARGLILATLGALLLGPFPGFARAQEAGNALRSLTPDNARLWLSPLTLGLGRALSSGLVPALRSRGVFDLALGARVVASRTPGGSGSFQPQLPATVLYGGSEHPDPYQGPGGAPTVAASRGGGSTLVPRPGSSFEAALLEAGQDPRDFALELPGGLGLDASWIPLLEATLGLGLGTDLVARFAPTLSWDDGLGDASVFGVALLHSLDRWLGLSASPFDLRLAGSLQRVRAGGYLEEVATTAGLVAGVAVGGLDLYLHGRMEDVRARIRQRVSNPAGNPALAGDGTVLERETAYDARARFGLGAIVRTTPLQLDAEVSPGGGGALSLRATLALPPRGDGRP